MYDSDCLSSRVLRLRIIVYVPFIMHVLSPLHNLGYHTNACISFHAQHSLHNHGIMLILASHSCIIVTEPSENEPVEPAESVEAEPGVQFAVEPEVNRGKQLSMNHGSYLTCFSLVISLGYCWVIYILGTYYILVPIFMHSPSLIRLFISLAPVRQLIA